MCCRTTCVRLDPEAAEYVLEKGLFRPLYTDPTSGQVMRWERLIAEEGTSVTAELSEVGLSLSISPSISVYSQHEGKRLAASVLFSIAATYAEKVGGEVIQRGAVAGCRHSGASGDLVIAEYPVSRIDFESVCRGFSEVLMDGHLHGFAEPRDDNGMPFATG